MEKNKKIILISGILIVILGGFLIMRKSSLAPVVEENNLATTTSKVATSTDSNSKVVSPSAIIKPQSNSIKDVAWATFSVYLAFNKSHNLDGVKSVVYKVNPVCGDKVATDECKNRMDSAYSYGSILKKEDFTNVWSDSKQTILSTDFKIDEDSSVISRHKAIIFFINEGSGLKMLSFSPSKGQFLVKASSTRDELLNKLTTVTEDKDQDGLPDYDEQCLSSIIPAPTNCVKTDLTLRDTNGNGLWDGVDALINSMK